MLNITVIAAQAEANTQVIEDFSERLSLFGEVTLLGMGTVFIVSCHPVGIDCTNRFLL